MEALKNDSELKPFLSDPLLLPASWTEDEANHAKDYFHKYQPVVPRLLVTRLWEYWRVQGSEERLFEDDEDNIALILHAKAYGKKVPNVNDETFLGQLLREHREWFEPLTPAPLVFGPRAILAEEVVASLDSPIMHAWVFVEKGTPRQILIIGHGIPEIRQRVLSLAFMTSLRVYAPSTDLMNIGVIKIDLPGTPTVPLNIPANLIGDRRQPLIGNDATNAEAMLRELHGELKRLERDTALVQVHEVDIERLQAMQSTLQDCAQKANNGDATLWAPAHSETEPSDVVNIVPLLQLPVGDGVLRISFSKDLLQTETYKHLLEVYQYATIERLLADVRTRHAFYKSQADYHQGELDSYNNQNTREQVLAKHGPTVTLDKIFDRELGIWILLPEPTEKPTEDWFKKDVPAIIKDLREWQMKMEDIENSLKKVVEREDAPVYRFAASRFFDAAARSRVPNESETVASVFKTWSKEIQPLLWFEWRRHLRKLVINPEDVFTPHAFFHTSISADSTEIIMYPLSIFSQSHSCVLFEIDRRTLVIKDTTDYARVMTASPKPSDEMWSSLIEFAEDESRTEEAALKDFFPKLRDALSANPHEMTKRILEYLQNPAGKYETEDEEGEPDIIEKDFDAALDILAVTQNFELAITALNLGATLTARKAIGELMQHNEWRVRAHILSAIFECYQDAETFDEIKEEILKAYRNEGGAKPQVASALAAAEMADLDYVRNWIQQLENTEMSAAIAQLRHDFPRVREHCSKAQYAAFLARGAVEAAQIARELEEATVLLSEDREPIVNAFVKLGGAVEQALFAEVAGTPYQQLRNLLAVLTGRQPADFTER